MLKLNAGCGLYFLDGYINFDILNQVVGNKKTDVIGDLRNIKNFFPCNYFSEILCVHTIEHFVVPEVKIILNQFASLLVSGGKLIIESPDIRMFYEGYKVGKYNLQELIFYVYGGDKMESLYGDGSYHRSGWTGELMAKAVSEEGLEVIKICEGTFHGIPERDFRVEALKGDNGK